MCGVWSEHWQANPPPLQPLQQCWQHSYVCSQTQPLDMTLSTCTQLLWSTMARPVLSEAWTAVWSWPPCYISVSGFWQFSYSLRHLYVEQQLSFSDPQCSLPWGAMLNFQWPVWESGSDNTKFNTPAPHSHMRPCNTNESHDTRERKWLIGPNLDIFTWGCTHFWGQRFRH